MKILQINHIKLTVSDLEKSREFYEKLPGFKLVAKHPNFYMFACGNFYLGLTDHKGEQKIKIFDEKNVGLDHVSFTVESKGDLAEAQKLLGQGEIKELSNGLWVMAFRDPDNIQLEFCWKGK